MTQSSDRPLKERPAEEATEPASPVLELRAVSKHFGDVKAVDEVSFGVHPGEILTLLGPSGCGKTTTLRLIAGLERCDAGTISYEGRVVDGGRSGSYVPTHKRGMGMVFQSYAIWPHMTVFKNVAYGLRLRGVKGDALRDQVMRALELVGLEGLEQRRSTQLSGGQQQRVAVARSLAYDPRLLLLDEPFSNLDARRREQMRLELRQLQRRLGIPAVFVTHDQVEALSLSDRIAVMDGGRLQQIGSPRELYRDPKTANVRDFLGQTVIIPGQVGQVLSDGRVEVVASDGHKIVCGSHAFADAPASGTECFASIRPEAIKATSKVAGTDAGDHTVVPAEIFALLFVGAYHEATLELPWGQRVLMHLPDTGEWSEGACVALRLPQEALRAWPA